MNAITKAIQEIKFNIPQEVLNIAFLEYDNEAMGKVISLDERIVNKVIRARCLMDCNVVQGIDMKIDLNNCGVKWMYNSEHIIEVPKTVTQGKSIIAPLEIICNVIYTNTFPTVNTSPLVAMATKMYNGVTNHNVIQSSKLELIGENTILVHDPTIIILNGVLRCKVEYDSNMSSLTPSAYIHFGKLCVLACKAYIYNHCKVKLDQGYVYSGHELSVITEIVDRYEDANEQYYEFLESILRKTLFMNQSDNMNRFVKAMFGHAT